jgi:catechol 2,3-dioxygenase-like lactoylglutathione lyase family enzyme
MYYSSKPEELRAFVRDKLGFTSFTDVGGGWLIFNLPEADLGVHPAGPEHPAEEPAGTHYVSFYCDDLEKTVAELRARGVEFTDEISDAGYGLAIHFEMPGGIRTELYQPRYQKNPL